VIVQRHPGQIRELALAAIVVLMWAAMLAGVLFLMWWGVS
jgi:hypothetical protein